MARYRARLIELIADHYNPHDFGELVERVTGHNIRDEWVGPGDPFVVVVSEVVTQLRKQGLLVGVMREIMADRSTVLAIQKEFPELIRAVRIEAGENPDEDPAATVAGPLQGVAALLAVPAISPQEEALVREWRENLDHIRIYKDLHDCLHYVQLHFAALEEAVDEIGQSDENDGTGLFAEALDIFRAQGQYARMAIEAFPQELRAEEEVEQRWMKNYEAALTLAESSIDSADSKGAGKSVIQFRRILRREPTRIDTKLGELAASLDLDALRNVLQGDTYTQLRGIAEELLSELKVLVDQHRQWQMMDFTLWEVDDQLRYDPTKAEPFDTIWQDVGDFLADLMKTAPGSEWKQIVRYKAAADAARLAGSPAKLTGAFRSFRRSCLLAFYNMDGTLKSFSQGERVRNFLNKLPKSIGA